MLDRLGYDERWKRFFEPYALQGFLPGRVVRVDRGSVLVQSETGIVRAAPSHHLLKTALPTDLPAVGDWVGLRTPETTGGPWLIEAVLPRFSAFSRADPGKASAAQVLAANIDTVFVVHSLSSPLNRRRLERELVMAWESGASPVVVLTKADLCIDVAAALVSVEETVLGTPVHAVSNLTGEGIEELRAYAGPGRTVAVLGRSGVGKSTLINRLVGAEVQATQEVRESDDKGRHTTVARELVLLPDGGVMIDTPGLRALALWDAEEGMAQAFADVENFAHHCRFRDCTHTGEPGCAVRTAVEDGKLPAERLDSYHALMRELAFAEAKQDARLRSERKRKWKIIHKAARGYYREHGRGDAGTEG